LLTFCGFAELLSILKFWTFPLETISHVSSQSRQIRLFTFKQISSAFEPLIIIKRWITINSMWQVI
jgi:hypothetical protein